MQRNQSFFASSSHLYNIYDYFLSSRAKVRQNFGTDKLFLNFFVRKICNIFFDGENKKDTADDRQENTPTIKDDETSD